jgi:hypothetical protein
MEKAYDLKALGQMIVDEAKKDGLVIAEQALEKLGKAVYVGSKNWAKESAVLSSNKIDDVIAPFYDHADPLVIPQIEKLDLDGDGK